MCAGESHSVSLFSRTVKPLQNDHPLDANKRGLCRQVVAIHIALSVCAWKHDPWKQMVALFTVVTLAGFYCTLQFLQCHITCREMGPCALLDGSHNGSHLRLPYGSMRNLDISAWTMRIAHRTYSLCQWRQHCLAEYFPRLPAMSCSSKTRKKPFVDLVDSIVFLPGLRRSRKAKR